MAALMRHSAERLFGSAGWSTVVLLGLCWVGCGGDSEIPRYELSGTVTFRGEPVPAGYIEFTPDRGAGNPGPGTQADIEGGRYATRPGRGSIGGPHVLAVYGYNGVPVQQGPVVNPLGTPVCQFQDVPAELPRSDGSYDIELPLPK